MITFNVGDFFEKSDLELASELDKMENGTLIGLLVDAANLLGWHEANRSSLSKSKTKRIYEAAKKALKSKGIEFSTKELE